MSRTIAGPDDIDDRLSIASSIWMALENSVVDEDSSVSEFFAVRNMGADLPGEMRIIITDGVKTVLRTYKVTIERCEP